MGLPLEIRFVRLDDDVCATLNRMATERQQRVSDLVNEVLRRHLGVSGQTPSADLGCASSGPG
jgi:hypothetical protein